MRELKHRWTPLLLAGVLLTGCGGDDAESSKDNSSAANDDAVLSDGDWDSEEERLDELGLPKHKIVIDGEETYSESNQEQWDLFNGGDYDRDAYEEAFLNFVSCIEDNDSWIQYLDLNEEIINYTTTAGSDPDDYCYTTHYMLIDGDWQGNHPQDQSDKIQFYIDCLEDEDIDPAHKEPATEPGPQQDEQSADLWDQAQENNIDCEYNDPTFDELFDE